MLFHQRLEDTYGSSGTRTQPNIISSKTRRHTYVSSGTRTQPNIISSETRR